MSRPLKTVTLLFAMQGEADPFIREFQLTPLTDLIPAPLPMQAYTGIVSGLELYVIVSGTDKRHGVDNIGCEPATLMAYEAIRQTQPDLLISAGTAGGFAKRGAEIGTVYLSDEHFIFHDRHVPLAHFDLAAIGRFPSANTDLLARHLRVNQGIMSSGSSLKKNASDIAIIEAHEAVSKDMESAAVAWVADLFQTPFIGLKSITNLVDLDNDSESEFVENFQRATAQLNLKLFELIRLLPNKSLADLQII